MKITETTISGVKIIQLTPYEDNRGYFTETYKESTFKKIIPEFKCLQLNQNKSHKNVVRGMHWQHNKPMGKLVRALVGTMYDLLLDIRTESETFGKSEKILLDNDLTWVWVPPNVAHGNYFLTDAKVEYICTEEYNKSGEDSVNPLSVFELPLDCICSEKDKNAITFQQWKTNRQI